MEPCEGRKRLPHKRHLWRLEEREYPPLETCKSEKIFPGQRKRRRKSSLKNRPTAVGLGKATCAPKRTYLQKPRCGATRTRSYSESRTSVQFLGESTSQSRIESEAELNHYGNIHSPLIKAVQSISKSDSLQTFENFEGGLVDT